MSSMYGSTGQGVGARSSGGGMGNKVPSGYKSGRLQNFTPEMMELFKSLFGHVGEGSYLSRLAGGDESLFEEMEAPALRQFSGLQGNLASRFSGMGMGARRSSGFQNTSNQAASDFAQDLQSKRQGLQQQAIRDLMGLSGSLLGQRPYEQFLTPKSSWLDSLGGLGGLLGGIGKIGSLFA
jgi:hypothetical protein